jgi:ribosomal protein S18 acetylase RimI-like enzyme
VIRVRAARADDAATIVEWNCLLARESEGKELDRARIVPGVRAVLADPNKGRYFVAEREGVLAGQLMHTFEWSDWRNGQIWWLQSVYVPAAERKGGVFRALYEHLVAAAEADPEVVALRLYAETHNEAALATYRRLGMTDAGYLVLERRLRSDY